MKTEVYPGRRTMHFVIGAKEELDGELLEWLEQACAFFRNGNKRKNRRGMIYTELGWREAARASDIE